MRQFISQLPLILDMKYCPRCETTLPLSEFGPKKETKDGYRYCCRKCASKYDLDRRHKSEDGMQKARDATKRHREKFKHTEKYKERARESNQRSYYKDVEKSRALAKKWRDENPEHKLHMNRLRLMALKKRIPKWADIDAIKEIYKNCPEGHHVDHVIPINGKIVSGLHVESNLQYLTAEDNMKKKNSFDQEDFTIIF